MDNRGYVAIARKLGINRSQANASLGPPTDNGVMPGAVPHLVPVAALILPARATLLCGSAI
jgi:hypothetical protein